ncbi:carboxymuconolactone decarboxylase family protein [Dubosiella newyorkensis]|uniref:carboxymuconolactone decarboxylase family protein n=1 Tax=Dubosiella newyorkensis TaxID=1862672 RepID=UPI0023F1E039|nr:carboxymuconolactone decarboxylase family protein [Dubosiella newyorkensis]
MDRNVQVRQDRQTTNLQDCLEKGNALQVRYFGEGLKETWKNGGERENVNYWLAANCFGDYYTRKGLNDQEREMVTFCYVYAQGGCENQLRGHTRGNLNVGNSKEKLLAILSTCIPWIGYPRTLNAWAIVDEVTKE